MPVVDDQRRPPGSGEALADFAGERQPSGRRLGDGTDGRPAHRRWDQAGGGTSPWAQHETERPGFRVETNQPLAPAVLRALKLADRQGVEELVGDQDQRAVRHRSEPIMPARPEALERRPLTGAERGTDFDQMHLYRGSKRRHGPCRAQRVGHQRAAPGTEFDQVDGRGPAHLYPDRIASLNDRLPA